MGVWGGVVPVGTAIPVVGPQEEKIGAPPPASKAESRPAPAPAPSAPALQTPPQPAAPEPETSAPEAGFVKASPLAKKMAQDENIDLSRLHGSGPGGRIVRRDVEAALASGAGAQPSATGKLSSAVPMPPVVPVKHEDETITPSKLRQAIGRRMAESKATAPHFYVSHE